MEICLLSQWGKYWFDVVAFKHAIKKILLSVKTIYSHNLFELEPYYLPQNEQNSENADRESVFFQIYRIDFFELQLISTFFLYCIWFFQIMRVYTELHDDSDFDASDLTSKPFQQIQTISLTLNLQHAPNTLNICKQVLVKFRMSAAPPFF